MLQRLYSIWVIFSIAVLFFVFAIPLFICIPFIRFHNIALWINHLWAWLFFRIAFIPVKTNWGFELQKGQQYILCGNHFSYLDIPALGLFPAPFKFVGKSQLKSIPLFGIMYDGLHITVDRKSYKSRALSLAKARNAVDKGFSLGFFPEGGVRFTKYPQMAIFKDGAFRIACEKGIPIIPVSMPNNHFILKDDNKYLVKRVPCIINYHKPIWPSENSEEGVRILKKKVSEVIQSKLNSL